MYKATATAIKGEIDSHTITVGTLTPHLHQWTDQPYKKSSKNTGFKCRTIPDRLN